jgi:hypothetical protein
MEEYKKMESSEYYLDEFVDPYSILPLFGEC